MTSLDGIELKYFSSYGRMHSTKENPFEPFWSEGRHIWNSVDHALFETTLVSRQESNDMELTRTGPLHKSCKAMSAPSSLPICTN